MVVVVLMIPHLRKLRRRALDQEFYTVFLRFTNPVLMGFHVFVLFCQLYKNIEMNVK